MFLISWFPSQPDKALLCLQDVEKTSLKSLDALNSGAAEAVNKREVKQAILRAKFSAYGKNIINIICCLFDLLFIEFFFNFLLSVVWYSLHEGLAGR